MTSRMRLLALVGLALALWAVRSQLVGDADALVSPRAARAPVAAAPRDVDPSQQICSTPGALPVRAAFAAKGATDPFAAYAPPAPPAPRVAQAPPPPPVVVIAPPPAPPVAPAPPVLPYRFLGAVREPGVAPRVFLARGEALITAQAGDTLDGGFRLESVAPRELVFMHLQQQRTVRLAVEGEPQ
jgi:hypothetical protein